MKAMYGKLRWLLHTTTWTRKPIGPRTARCSSGARSSATCCSSGAARTGACTGRPSAAGRCTTPEGRFLGYHGTGRDVTQQVSAEQRLRKFNVALERKVVERTAELDAANQELEAFSYSVSHDLRAPLRAIDGFPRMLSRSATPAARTTQARDYLAARRAAAERMGQLIEDLLAFSRIGRAELHEARRGPQRARAGWWRASWRDGAPERRVEWRIAEGLAGARRPGPGARGAGEPARQRLEVHRQDAAGARIEFGRTGGRASSCVRDNGAGFDMAFADDGCSSPFSRLHARRSSRAAASGWPRCSASCERHGGSVRAEGAVDAGRDVLLHAAGAPS